MSDIEKFISNSSFFDSNWYQNELVKRGICCQDKRRDQLFCHYLEIGWKKGINPSCQFDGERYLKDYPDIKEAGINPLIHYELYGKKEGRVFYSCLEFPCEIGDIYLDNLGLHILLISPNQEVVQPVIPGKKLEIKKIPLSKDQEKFNSYLLEKKGNRRLSHFLIVNQFKLIKFRIISQSGKKASLSSLNAFSCRNFKYLFNTDQAIPAKNDIFVLKNLLFNRKINFKNKLLILKSIKKTRNKLLFTESLNNCNDNAYSLFLYCLKNKILEDEVFFITSIEVINSIKDNYIKSHLIERGSSEHLKALLQTKTIIASYTFDGFQAELDKFIPLLINPKLFFVPHGISFDKNSFYLNDIFLGHPDCTFCCSHLEKVFFKESCGLNKIRITGYPRMDKWVAGEDERMNNSVFLFFTWRKSITTEFKKKFYLLLKELTQIKKVYIGIHPNQSPQFQFFLNHLKSEAHLDFEVISVIDREKFNQIFSSSPILITDYSSVAYDFMYANNKKVFYYAPLKETQAEYKTLPIWQKNCLGKEIKDLSQLLIELDLPCDDIYTKRRLIFFKWIDANNCYRVIQAILTS